MMDEAVIDALLTLFSSLSPALRVETLRLAKCLLDEEQALGDERTAGQEAD